MMLHKIRIEHHWPLPANRFFSRHVRRYQELFEHVQGGENGARAAAIGAAQDEPIHLFGVVQGEFLGNHPPHRDAKDMRPEDAEMAQQTRRIRRHHGKRVDRVGFVAIPRAPIVERDDLKGSR